MQIIVALTLFASGCNGGKDSGSTDGTDGAEGTGFCAVESLFRAQCVSCHSAGLMSGDLNLETDVWAAVVNRESTTFSGAILVLPGDPDGSLLYRKMAGTQGATEGDPMPPAGVLDAAAQRTVSDWILAGATSECGGSDTDTTAGTRHHAAGFDDADVHGIAAKLQTEACVDCHGTDLAGGATGVGCDTCHASGWRTDCTYCHGGSDNATGAPPVDIDGATTGLSFATHTSHVTATNHAAFSCAQCHAQPVDVLAVGHLFLGDTTPGVAEMTFSGGLSPAGSYAGAGTCSNLYCHGDGQSGSTGEVRDTATATCTMCHAGADAASDLSGEHSRHIGEGYDCATCHADVSGYTTIVTVAAHVNGRPDVTLPAGIERTGGECTGSCHGEDHSGRGW